jgi:hypothetical protein
MMLLHLPPDHVYRAIGVFLDGAQLILIAGVGYLMWRMVRILRQGPVRCHVLGGTLE